MELLVMTTETATIKTSAIAEPASKKPAVKKPAIKKTVAKKPAAKKPVAAKAVASKPAVKKATTRKPVAKKAAANPAAKKGFVIPISAAKLKESAALAQDKIKTSADKAQVKIKDSADKAQDMIKTVVYAQLGVYGTVYDEVTSRFESTRKEAPKQWGVLSKRGEKFQKDFEKSGVELKSRLKDIDLKNGVEKVTSSGKESLTKVKELSKKAA